jgi:hypothetical protein
MATWKAQRTLLLVGEGRDDAAFLRHVKGLYVPRGCGLSVTIKHAHGKGAKGVIDWTVRQIANVAYDQVAAMVDTDQDWSPGAARLARSRQIVVLKSEPCLEGVLLRMLGEKVSGDSATLKKRLAPFVDNDPTEPSSYGRFFDTACLRAGRQTEPAIDTLLKLMGAA